MNNIQLNHEESQFLKKKSSVVLVCDTLKSPANAGSLIRLADAFGIECIYFCGTPINLESNRLKRTARSTEKSVDIKMEQEIVATLKNLKNEEYVLLGLEITSSSSPIHSMDFTSDQKIALVIGNERTGIADRVLQMLDRTAHIPMQGNNSSMNVSHAAAIAFYELTKVSNL